MVVCIAENSACAHYAYPILAYIAASAIVLMTNCFEKTAKAHQVVSGSDIPSFLLTKKGRYDHCLANHVK
jgi:hypothetical protein